MKAATAIREKLLAELDKLIPDLATTTPMPITPAVEAVERIRHAALTVNEIDRQGGSLSVGELLETAPPQIAVGEKFALGDAVYTVREAVRAEWGKNLTVVLDEIAVVKRA